MKRQIGLIIRAILMSLIAFYLIDWAVFRLRLAHGGGYDTIQVDEYLSTALKGNKAEYDYLGSTPVSCARAVFPHGASPCWWVAHHKSRWE